MVIKFSFSTITSTGGGGGRWSSTWSLMVLAIQVDQVEVATIMANTTGAIR
jgi:hypothetical protein